ncbi:DUF6551 family protein [Paracoccus sp. AK26]|uniref:DUF6551 family protein n=1 Tax=Paracoccus sp. AK26 TaxID=2589076 RepID=UPI0014285A12|nr:DUF6551 family protein [Paracoccus sp. AK26]QIR85035.1 hypothetical protein FIU66_07330 [Paracoccus sp. AK26]
MTKSLRPVSDLVDAWLRKQHPEGRIIHPADTVVEYRLVPVESLVIDRLYQRALSAKGRSTVARIISDFSWLKFGAISVSHHDGKLAVIDGQHRAIAAAAIGINHVPALVSLADASGAAEADAFVGINDVRTTVTPVDKFRAKVAAGDPQAVELADILRELDISTDIVPGTPLRPRQTRSISALYKLIKAHGRGIVFTSLEILLDGQEDNPEALSSLNIQAVAEVTERVVKAGGDIDRLARVIEETDFDPLAESARQLRKISGGAMNSHAATMLIRAYDKGLRNSKLGSAPA